MPVLLDVIIRFCNSALFCLPACAVTWSGRPRSLSLIFHFHPLPPSLLSSTIHLCGTLALAAAWQTADVSLPHAERPFPPRWRQDRELCCICHTYSQFVQFNMIKYSNDMLVQNSFQAHYPKSNWNVFHILFSSFSCTSALSWAIVQSKYSVQFYFNYI